MTLKLFTDDLVNLDPEKYITGDVVGAITQISMEERMDGESSWPEIGKIINRVKAFRKRRLENAEREAQSRRLPAGAQTTGSLADEDPDIQAMVARLNAKIGAKMA